MNQHNSAADAEGAAACGKASYALIYPKLFSFFHQIADNAAVQVLLVPVRSDGRLIRVQIVTLHEGLVGEIGMGVTFDTIVDDDLFDDDETDD